MTANETIYLLGEARAVLRRCLEKDKDNTDIQHGLYSIEELATKLGVNINDDAAAEAGNLERYASPEAQLARKMDWAWRDEIKKYLPQISVMSFAGPRSTIRWLMEHVDIKPEHAELANRLKEIEESDLSAEQKTHARLTSIFPGLRGNQEG
jgi:hypothetical protein